MASVPYTGAGPEVAPDARPPDDLQRIDATPDAFGAAIGRGLQQLGESVEKAEKFHDQVSVDDQVNKVMSAADVIRRGDPNKVQVGADGKPVLGPDGKPQPDLGYLGLRGEAAMQARPQVQAQQRQQGVTQDAARKQVFDTMQGVYVRGEAPRPGAPAAEAPVPATSPRHADFVSGQQLKAAEAAAQVRDRKPVLSDADRAADAADQQLLDRYKASHGIPRTTGIDPTRVPDDPPQAMRDTSADPVPHPDTHVLPSHPHVGSSPAPVPSCARSAAGLPTPVPGAPAVPFFAAIGGQYGISGNFLAHTKVIESGTGSGAHSVSSSGAMGPLQFTRETARRMGLVDPSDLAKSADATARLAVQNRTALTRTLGRAPDDAELYLVHQQGSGGAAKLVANPNVRAGDLVGDSAIRSNGGDQPGHPGGV